MKSTYLSTASVAGDAQSKSNQIHGRKSVSANPYLGITEDKYPKKFSSNFFNDELDRLHMIDENQEMFLYQALNDGPAPGKHTIGMVRQYDTNGVLVVDSKGNPVLKSTQAEHIRTLQKAFNTLLPVINKALVSYLSTPLGRVKENGIYDEEFREAVRSMQIAGNFEYREGFIGRETLGYMDKALRRMETSTTAEEEVKQSEINSSGYRKRVLEAFEIAFNEDVRRLAREEIELYEEYVMDSFNPSPTRSNDKSPMATVQNVKYEASLLGDNQVVAEAGHLNIFGEVIDVNIEYYRGSSTEANTIGSIDYIGKDITFKSLAGTFHKIKGHIFLAKTSPYDVSIHWGGRSFTIDQKDVERGLGYVSMDDANFMRLMAIHDRFRKSMVRDHFVNQKRESDFWRARANIAFYDKVQPFYETNGRGKTAEEVEAMIFKEKFFAEYITAMDRYIELQPGAMGKAQLAEFNRVRKKYFESQKASPIKD